MVIGKVEDEDLALDLNHVRPAVFCSSRRNCSRCMPERHETPPLGSCGGQDHAVGRYSDEYADG